jgi:Protein of unknown function (DUF664)
MVSCGDQPRLASGSISHWIVFDDDPLSTEGAHWETDPGTGLISMRPNQLRSVSAIRRNLAVWRSECRASAAAASRYGLDFTGKWREKQVSRKSIYLHMIQEYARHNGHADLIRELLGGSVGL